MRFRNLSTAVLAATLAATPMMAQTKKPLRATGTRSVVSAPTPILSAPVATRTPAIATAPIIVKREAVPKRTPAPKSPEQQIYSTVPRYSDAPMQRRVEMAASSTGLEAILGEVSSPEQAQHWVSRNIDYVRRSSFVFGRGNDDLYNRVPAILQKRAGNCKEGFVLVAGLLRNLGYEVSGLALMPEQGDGHIVAVYRDRVTKKYGTAGIRNGDFTMPVYATIDAVASEIALQHLWTKAKVQSVAFDDRLLAAGPRIALPTTVRDNVDLQREMGVAFESKKLDYGIYAKRHYPDGMVLSIEDALIPSRDTVNNCLSVITDLEARYSSEKRHWQVTVEQHDALSAYRRTTVFFDDVYRPTFFLVSAHDARKLHGTLLSATIPAVSSGDDARYAIDNQHNRSFSKMEVASYVRLAQSALELLQAREARAGYAAWRAQR